MIEKRHARINTWVRARLRDAPQLWEEAAPALRTTLHGLELALVASPLARRAAGVFIVAQVLYAAELALLGHWLTGILVLMVAAGCDWLQRHGRRDGARRPRLLLLTSEGRLHLLDFAGRLEEVCLLPASLRLGPWLLLVLSAGPRRIRLLLGPDNLPAEKLAALRRRLRDL